MSAVHPRRNAFAEIRVPARSGGDAFMQVTARDGYFLATLFLPTFVSIHFRIRSAI
jgi:hypothetical protein